MASDEGDEVENSGVDVGFEIGGFFAGILVVSEVVRGNTNLPYTGNHLRPEIVVNIFVSCGECLVLPRV